MKIGFRTIKTGIAVTLALFISNILKIESPFYAVIAAIIAIQPTVSDSWKKGIYRLLGTMMGAVVGVIFVSISPGNPILAGLGIIFIILVMNKLNWGEAISIGGVVFIGIFLNAEGGYIDYSLHRLLDTSIGIVVAVAVNYIIYPPNYDDKIVEEARQISKDLLNYYIKAIQILLKEEEEDIAFLEEQIQEIEEELDETERFLKLQKKEERVKLQENVLSKEIQLLLNLEKQTFEDLRNMQDILQKGIKEEVVELVREDIYKIKQALIQVKIEEKKEYRDHTTDHKDAQKLSAIIKDIKKVKKQLKNNENLDNYPTDEVVKLLVFLYNLEEALLKFDIIINF